MTDRAPFEDMETIDRYVNAIPEPDRAYRAELRARLAAAPARFRWLPSPRWRWTAGASAAVAVAAAIALLLVPFGPHQNTPLNPRAALARAVTASTNPIPYRGSSEMSFVSPPEDAPDAVSNDLGTTRITSTWAVQDTTHWRVDVHLLQPVLQSDHWIAVADGASAVWYRTITNRAVRYSLNPPVMGGVLLSMLQGGRAVPLAQTLEQYLQALNNKQTGTHARFVGEDTVLGRTADVIEVWPVVRGSTGAGSCKSPKQCAQRSKQFSYGRARLWIDHQHGLVLRYQEYGLPSNGGYATNFTYRVTSVNFGAGPSAAELAYRPPVTPVAGNMESGIGESGGTSFGGAPQNWRPPAGFIPADPPRGEHGRRYTLSGSGQGGDAVLGGTSADALFLLNPPRIGPHTPPPPQSGTGVPTKGPFLYIQEQHRADGLPAGLAAGARHVAGHCAVYTGTYPDGLHWIALQQRSVTFLAVANQLTDQNLVTWVATAVCR